MKAYLDFNIIVSLLKGDITLDRIRQLDVQIADFPFSAAHIEEIDNIAHVDNLTRDKLIESHLSVLSSTSNNLYLYQQLSNEVQLLSELPANVLQTAASGDRNFGLVLRR